MKNNLQKIFRLALFCLVFGCAAVAFGQTRLLPGEYKPVSVANSEVRQAAEFAVQAKTAEVQREIQLDGVTSAESLSVQGTDYRLCLQLVLAPENEDEAGVQFYVKTIVHKTLNGEFKMTSWQMTDCAEL
jgi:hypothetical protein